MRVCGLLVGLGEVGVGGEEGEPLGVRVRCRALRPPCGLCGGLLWSLGGRVVVLVGLPVFGGPVRLVWRKRRWRCPQRGCGAGSVTGQSCGVAACGEGLTARAGRWATRQAGRGRAVGDVASALGCGWRAVNASVQRWGRALLEAGTSRVSAVTALGLDETLFARRGRYRAKAWPAGIAGAASGQSPGMVPGRTEVPPFLWRHAL